MKRCIMVGYEEEKLLALRMYAEQRGVSVEEELAQAAEAMYQKVVPANVRAFVDMKVESQKPKRKGCFRLCCWGLTVNEEERGSRKKAIRLKCLDCCCGSAYEVRLCPARQCPLWRFRLGTECREESTENAEGSQENCLDESPPVGKEVLK